MKSLRIMGLEVTLEVIDSDSDSIGEWDENTTTLRLAAGLPPTRRAEVLWHEILHAISSRLSLGLSETLVQRIAAAQYAVMRENPGLVKFLAQTGRDATR